LKESTVTEDFVYSFDASNTPVLAQTLLPGQSALGVPLLLESDAVYEIRAIEITDPTGLALIRLRDGFGNYLEDDWTPSAAFAGVVTQEPALVSPAGAALLLDLRNAL